MILIVGISYKFGISFHPTKGAEDSWRYYILSIVSISMLCVWHIYYYTPSTLISISAFQISSSVCLTAYYYAERQPVILPLALSTGAKTVIVLLFNKFSTT